ncbi:transposase (plasmid) [Streptomyces sp. NBC_00868]|nr:transposase [Streptomyces sp. NBC_00868]
MTDRQPLRQPTFKVSNRTDPVQGFAAFLQNDWAAVVNGLTLNWSSGAVEGQVTRIKLIKRRSYGRASFGLLRTLILAQPP